MVDSYGTRSASWVAYLSIMIMRACDLIKFYPPPPSLVQSLEYDAGPPLTAAIKSGFLKYR
jgi:hypothetical protein